MTATYDLRPARGRFRTRGEGRDTWHCFSFGEHYDPANVALGPLMACNDDTLAPGAGYPPHRHQDVEIVTWVVDGELTHEDSAGHHEVVRAGEVQHLSAGSGIQHSERNAGRGPVRFVQMWVRPMLSGTDPTYLRRDLAPALSSGELCEALEVDRHVMWVGRLPGGSAPELPAAPHLHVYLVGGTASLPGVGELVTGDALRVTVAPADQVAGAGALTAGRSGAEVLVWALT